MALEMALWRAGDNRLSRITPSMIGLESELETYIASDPSVLGTTLLIFGRQVPTTHGGFVDLVGLDETGAVHVLELKRHKTPRDVTAQALDYGSWAHSLSRSDIVAIWSTYNQAKPFEEAFADLFGQAPRKI